MYCKICGASLAPGEVFCKNCGASNANVEPTTPKVEPTSVQTVAQPPVQAPMPEQAENQAVPMPEQVETEAPVQATVEEPKENGEAIIKKTEDESIEKKDNGKFLVVIGVIVGLLATAVIGYLVYSSLQGKNEQEKGADVVVVTQTNYSVSYGGYKFLLQTNINSSVGKYLDLKGENWTAKISYSETPEFSKITADNLKKTFETARDYRIGDFAQKNYADLPCFEANVEYVDGSKTILIFCKREAAGYWYVEIGTGAYTAYPTSDIANDVVTLLANAKKEENNENRLQIGDVNIVIEEQSSETTPTE